MVCLQAGRAGRHLRALVAAGFLCMAPAAWGEDLVLAIARHAGATVQLSRTAVAAIFGMRMTTWPDGTPIRVFVLKDEDPLHILFCKQVLHVFPHQMRAAWDRLVFSGTGRAPETVETMAEMRSRIAATDGGIGYLNKEMIDEKLAVIPIR